MGTRRCDPRPRHFVPVNLPLEAAINLHASSRRRYEGRDDASSSAIVQAALLAVLFAATPTTDDLRRQLDYVSALPITSWAWPEKDAETAREEWLRGITRCLTWIMSEDAAKSSTDSNAIRAE
ncbi:hypothetical protein [Bradyrhizobium sp. LB5.2]|uniref:hypothetical protein n=1 Tax=Bradyrhizobium sp. LB5.2 TaxID=3156329 RepID=UPI003394A832